ncbi:MAG TPA: universal stress protein [Mycobacteriales bacterium]|nr:universal stress protein [Mycobacteriales bacterium]
MANDQAPIVVVGVDGSPESQQAVDWAERYATASGATLRLVIAWEHAQAYGQPMMFEGYHPHEEADALVNKVKGAMAVPADRVETRVVEGAPGPALVASAEGADALVVGSQGHGAVSSLLLGSVSSYCVHHASCPIVVVR